MRDDNALTLMDSVLTLNKSGHQKVGPSSWPQHVLVPTPQPSTAITFTSCCILRLTITSIYTPSLQKAHHPITHPSIYRRLDRPT
jgi:hypothetical protein